MLDAMPKVIERNVTFQISCAKTLIEEMNPILKKFTLQADGSFYRLELPESDVMEYINLGDFFLETYILGITSLPTDLANRLAKNLKLQRPHLQNNSETKDVTQPDISATALINASLHQILNLISRNQDSTIPTRTYLPILQKAAKRLNSSIEISATNITNEEFLSALHKIAGIVAKDLALTCDTNTQYGSVLRFLKLAWLENEVVKCNQTYKTTLTSITAARGLLTAENPTLVTAYLQAKYEKVNLYLKKAELVQSKESYCGYLEAAENELKAFSMMMLQLTTISLRNLTRVTEMQENIALMEEKLKDLPPETQKMLAVKSQMDDQKTISARTQKSQTEVKNLSSSGNILPTFVEPAFLEPWRQKYQTTPKAFVEACGRVFFQELNSAVGKCTQVHEGKSLYSLDAKNLDSKIYAELGEFFLNAPLPLSEFPQSLVTALSPCILGNPELKEDLDDMLITSMTEVLKHLNNPEMIKRVGQETQALLNTVTTEWKVQVTDPNNQQQTNAKNKAILNKSLSRVLFHSEEHGHVLKTHQICYQAIRLIDSSYQNNAMELTSFDEDSFMEICGPVLSLVGMNLTSDTKKETTLRNLQNGYHNYLRKLQGEQIRFHESLFYFSQDPKTARKLFELHYVRVELQMKILSITNTPQAIKTASLYLKELETFMQKTHQENPELLKPFKEQLGQFLKPRTVQPGNLKSNDMKDAVANPAKKSPTQAQLLGQQSVANTSANAGSEVSAVNAQTVANADLQNAASAAVSKNAR